MWDPHTTTDVQRLEMIQHRAARFVTKNYSRAKGSMTEILKNLQWPTLEQRRKQSRFTTMFKIQNETIAIPIPDYINRQSMKITRQYHPAKFRFLKPNSNVYKYSFYPRTIQDWNDLPSNILNITSTESFKAAISDHTMK